MAIILSLSNIAEVISKEKNTDDILYQKLISELRCMVCQNQNLAESEAPLAIDLKNKVMEMIKDGKSEEYIKPNSGGLNYLKLSKSLGVDQKTIKSRIEKNTSNVS